MTSSAAPSSSAAVTSRTTRCAPRRATTCRGRMGAPFTGLSGASDHATAACRAAAGGWRPHACGSDRRLTGSSLDARLVGTVRTGCGHRRDWAAAAGMADQAVEQVPTWIGKLNAFTQQHFHTTLVSPSNAARSGQATAYLKEHAGDLLGAVFSVFTIGLFTFYLTANGPQIRRVLLSRMPPERQRRALWAWNTAIEKTGGYLYSRGLLALINGGLMFLTLKLLGVPYALPLAVFVGVVAEFIPIVGTYVAGAVPVLVALAAVSLVAALIVLAEILVYQQLENYLLSPRISQRTMELNAGV